MGYVGEIVSERGHYEEFVCAICVNLVDLEESILTSCSHVYCLACFNEWLKRKKSCPTCQKDLGIVGASNTQYLKMASPLAWRVLSKVKVKCPIDGCELVFDYSELQHHLVADDSHKNSNSTISSREKAMAIKVQADEKYRSRNFKDALTLYSKGISVCDEIPQLFCNRSAVYFSLKNYELSFQDAKRALEMDQDYEKAWVRACNCLIQLGRLDEGIKILKTKEKLSGKLENLLQEIEKMQDLYSRSKQMIKEGKFKQAKSLVGLLVHTSNSPNFLVLASRCEAELGNCEKAQHYALQVMRANPQNPAGYVVEALAFLYRNAVDDAMKYIKEALRLDPDDSDAKTCFKVIKTIRNGIENANKLVKEKEHEKAIQVYSDLLQIESVPKTSKLYGELLAHRGNSYYRLKNYAQAVQDCSKAIYIQEDLKRAWLTKMYALHAQEKHQQAYDELKVLMETWGQNDSNIRGAYENAEFLLRKSKRPDYYEILSSETNRLSSLSSEMEIKAAYKRKALEIHPDMIQDLSEKENAESKFKLAGEALEILTDSFKRKLYDQGFDKKAIEERVQRAQQQSNHHHHHNR